MLGGIIVALMGSEGLKSVYIKKKQKQVNMKNQDENHVYMTQKH